MVRTMTALVAVTAVRKKKQSEQLEGPFCYGRMVIIMNVGIFIRLYSIALTICFEGAS